MMSLALGSSLPAAAFASAELTPPTVAPVLSGVTLISPTDVTLDWTSSNKTGSPGFGYKVYLDINSGGYSLIATVGPTSYVYSNSMALGETYSFKIVPFNDAGDGPESNVYSAILPAL
jgi:hypothetical protein